MQSFLPKKMSSHRIYLFLLFSLFSFSTIAQNGRVEGSVLDESGVTIPGVIVSVDNGVQKVLSDVNGKFFFDLSAGQHKINAQFTGYDLYEKMIEVVAGATMTLDISMQPEASNLNTIVISAGKFEQDLGEVTVSMDVIKPRLLEEKNATSIDEILQQSSGVSIVDGEPQIRSGSGYSFGAGSRVQVLVDDLPMLSGDAGKPSWEFLPIENLSQVEIVKGAASVLYGSSALSGVINMRTAFPGEKPETQVTVFHGIYSDPELDSAKYWAGSLMKTGANFLHKRKIGQLDFVLGGYFLGDDGHKGPLPDSTTGKIDNSYNPFTADRYNADSRARMNLNLRYRSKKIQGLSFGVNTNWSTGNSLNAFIWENNTTGLYSAFEGSATRTIQLLGTVDPFVVYHGKKGAKHSLRSRFQTLDNENDNNQGNYSDVLYSEYQYQQSWDSIGVKNLVTTLGVVNQTTTSRGQLYLGGNEDGVNHSLNQAAFFQVDKKWGDRLNTSAGVRYEQFVINGEKEAKPVFRTGVNYRFGKATYLRGSYGQGYRFPSIAEKFIVTSLGAIRIYANPELKSETSYNTEFGIKQLFKFGKIAGYIDLAAFQQEYDNYIEFTFGQWATPTFTNLLGFGFKSVNTGKSRVRGIEASVLGEGKAGPVLIQFMGGYTFTEPVSLTPDLVYARRLDAQSTPVNYLNTSSDTTNYLLKYRMQHLIRMDVQATFRAWSLGVSYRYNSHMQNIDDAFGFLERTLPTIFNPGIDEWRREHVRPEWVIDMRAGYKINDHHKVALIVNNMLNRTYAIRPLDIEEPRLTTIQYTFNF